MNTFQEPSYVEHAFHLSSQVETCSVGTSVLD